MIAFYRHRSSEKTLPVWKCINSQGYVFNAECKQFSYWLPLTVAMQLNPNLALSTWTLQLSFLAKRESILLSMLGVSGGGSGVADKTNHWFTALGIYTLQWYPFQNFETVVYEFLLRPNYVKGKEYICFC